MTTHQPGILAPVPRAARSLFLSLHPGADPREAIEGLAGRELGPDVVVGLGPALVSRLGGEIAGLRELPNLVGPGFSVPSTPRALWVWLRGDEPGPLVHRGRSWLERMGEAFQVEEIVDGFEYEGGRDLTGYEDGTENPTGDGALQAAFVSGQGTGLDGSSFVAVQRWAHDLDRFQAMPQETRDHVIGRRLSDNEEIDDAPDSAHVKRTAQESFSPEAFVLRRSMPWASADGEGLLFVAFGRSLEAFEAQLRRMVGLEDGTPDALFRFTLPVTGASFWCPPVRNGGLDLSALSLQ